MRRAFLLSGVAALGLAKLGRAQTAVRTPPPPSMPIPAAAPLLVPATPHFGPGPAAELPSGCMVPEELQNLRFALPRMTTLVQEGEAVRILAIGSSSTAGVGATAPGHAYPSRLQDALLRLLPGAKITVRNDGIGGEVASTTLIRMRKAIEDWKPDVVLWQLGTNDAVRHITPEAFSETMRQGVDFVQERGLDLVLIDPQFYAGQGGEDLYRLIVQTIERVAAEKQVPLMRRYAIMRYWDAAPQKASMLSADGFHMNDLGYLCMAETLAGGMAQRLMRNTIAARP
ncbi:SGNH/GDSL hydrolase family protein [Roseomonas marmotae]|uniref:SGNH/GDSL hydrolase family protein n=1 Tax=Roseomonas marmotae TaxID=2768161 RepID=A0ABS3KCR8_9PROT|nr:SGNH/GDSL hydrolase family protein [Roseomonas marmotae]MBO1074720.1 SGNH/GDSL hydrolase family protein [Roseomonas marmotae]QTI77815.1 SGNH/GDSL hydrolase family protein [Roseomonas marmotae]